MNAQSKKIEAADPVIGLPDLSGVATEDLVDKVGTGSYSARYINWARTMQMLRVHAPGWQPSFVPNDDSGILHRAPVGAFMLLHFRNGDQVTEPVPHAVMDNRNNAIPYDKITARDVTDAHRRGICLAAALTFGLAYELWAKMPLETGFADKDGADQGQSQDGAVGPDGSNDPGTAAKRVKLDGPYTSKTALWAAFKAFDRELRGCGDSDEFELALLTKEATALMKQCERDAPQLLEGGPDMPEEFVPLLALIEQRRAEFKREPSPADYLNAG